MDSKQPRDYFEHKPGVTQAVTLADEGSGEGEDRWYERYIDVTVENDVPRLTFDDAAAAIAGVLHLYQKPLEDLHGYTQYLDATELFLRSINTYQTAADSVSTEKPRDPLAALGI